MTTSLVLLAIYLACLLLLAWPLGTYLARVLRRRPVFLDPLLLPVERVVLRLAGVRREADDEPIATDWKGYSRAVLGFSLVGFVVLYLLLRTQHLLPLNPQALPAVPPDLAFNTALSFVTNTNWQSYGGETTLSYASQMLGLGVQNFMSAATGIAVMAALARGLVRRQGAQAGMLGNFWADLVRVTLYVLLPLSLLLAIVLATQGVVQTFAPYATVELLQPVTSSDGHTITQQVLPLGPAASQVAIKQLGTNGGGFFNVNSAHPFENPTALSNLLQMLAILLLPAACCFAFGDLVRDRRQGYALLLAMTLVFVLATVACMACEALGNPVIHALGVDQAASATQGGGNMEGKEARFGVGASALWATATTAASNGSVNAMHDSFTPLGGLVPLTMILLGEVIFGGVGSGLYGMLLFVVVTVFLAGLMVGRTPEYLGKRIEPFEMKMAALAIVLPAACVLVGTALAVLLEAGRAGIQDPGPHGFTEVLYAYASASNNNGSAFGGLSANAPLYNTTLGVAMFVGRFGVIIPVLAIAGSMAHKRRAAASHGTLPTHTPTFIALLIGAVLLVGALTFLPACALGPIVEHLTLWGGK